MAATPITTLASAAIVRPDGAPVPPALEAAVRAACRGGWRAVELALAGSAVRGHIDGADAVLALIAGDGPPRSDALAELRAVQTRLLDGLDLAALVASCGRVGDAPAVAAGRRRVRTLAIDTLRKQVATQPALAAALRDSAIAALLVDAARAVFRQAARTDRELARWAAPPTGTTSRDQALTAFCELLAIPDRVAALDRALGVPVPVPVSVPVPVPVPLPVPADPPPPVADPPASAPEPPPPAAEPPPPVADPPASAPEPPPPAPELPPPRATPVDPPPADTPTKPTDADKLTAAAAAKVPLATPERVRERPATARPAARRGSGWVVPALIVVAAIAAAATYLMR